nr:unnamed protein product [Callosobruchus analis]
MRWKRRKFSTTSRAAL